jgi:hypothetical protein
MPAILLVLIPSVPPVSIFIPGFFPVAFLIAVVNCLAKTVSGLS